MPSLVDKHSANFLYQQVVDLINSMYSSGSLRNGDKLPSLRKLSKQLDISVPTVKQAYVELERLGRVEARPKSGYFLKAAEIQFSSPKKASFVRRPVPVRCQSLIEECYEVVHSPNNLQLGISQPVMASPPDKALARIMRRVIAHAGPKAMAYGPMDGYLPLKRQLVQRYLQQGIDARPEDIIITNGAQEALAISLKCVAKAGDVIAVESPTYFGILELIENLGMMALEIPTCSGEGICIDDLRESLDSHTVAACVFSSLINNPVGSMMSEEKRKNIVKEVESRNIPLIEDAVYGELHFNESNQLPMQAYSTKGLVITCSSFSKTVVASYRVGWLFSNRFEEKAKGLKRALSCSTSLLNQIVIYEFIRGGDYDRHLIRLNQTLRVNKERMLTLITKYFPEKTRVSNPRGGGVVWIELPVGCDSIELFRLSVTENISITPGVLFSASGKYKRCVRVSYGLPWSDAIENAIEKLGAFTHQLLANKLKQVG
ncbi:MAG: PLP-dependent aminotransferase family protein [Kangiellaceae bacterium]